MSKRAQSSPGDPTLSAQISTPSPTTGQKLWRGFCRLMVRIFYRRAEIVGVEHLPCSGPVVLCANHVNALVDAVVIQASCPRPIHPLARSGLFRHPVLRVILGIIQAVPIYRRGSAVDRDVKSGNEASFHRCFEYLEAGRALLIFPEGQSHSDPMLRPLKTGAARLALGHRDRFGTLPRVIPIGLTFTHKGRFRTSLLIHYGEPVSFDPRDDEASEDRVRRYTAAIEAGLGEVTLNVSSWQDLDLLRYLQSFFALRRDRRPGQSTLEQRFLVLRRLIEAHRELRLAYPGEVQTLSVKLKRFKELCERYGVKDYHLNLRYRPGTVLRFLSRSLLMTVLVFPVALWGLVHNALPYVATRGASRLMARGRDQVDTAAMLAGLLLFLLFWSAQTFAVHWLWEARAALFYGVSLPLTGGVALLVSRERQRIVENIRVFWLFLRRRGLQDYLRLKRQEIEIDLARMTRLARDLE